MALVPAGHYTVGCDRGLGHPDDGEGPARVVDLDGFFIDRTAVTNSQFAAFVAETGYRTDAERFGWSFVFHLFVSPLQLAAARRFPGAEWWAAVPGATWRAPTGPGSSVDDLGSHPVVHVSWRDAAAYAAHVGKRLPTEAEWEAAAQTPDGSIYPWGDDFPSGLAAKANIFEGDFPSHNTGEDGYVGTAPAQSFEPNGRGLFNMVGNTWDWVHDWWSTNRSEGRNPQGPASGAAKVTKGGSYLCHDSYCNRYRVAARTSNTVDSSTGHIGFRLAMSASA